MGTRKTAYKKGLEFEQEFAEYLKQEMNYDKTKIRSQIKASQNSRGSNIDIIAERPNKKGIALKKLGNIYILLFVIVIIVGLFVGYSNSWKGNSWISILVLSVVFEFGGLIALSVSKANNIVNAWVECKNLKSKANINHIRKMVGEIAEYNESGDKRYKFYDFIFVSANGFVDNAIQLAEKNNIQCFIKDEKSFKRVTEWS